MYLIITIICLCLIFISILIVYFSSSVFSPVPPIPPIPPIPQVEPPVKSPIIPDELPIPAPIPFPSPSPKETTESNSSNLSGFEILGLILGIICVLVIIFYFFRVTRKSTNIECLSLNKIPKHRQEMIRNQNNQLGRKIVIIGGGPVGLFEAGLLKILLPENEIYVFEKRPEYVRSHSLKILPRTFEKLTEMPVDKKWIKMTQSWSPRTRTNVIEQDLKEYCKNIGVRVNENIEVQSIKDIYHFGIQPDIIIAADGAKSIWRKQINKMSEFSVDVTLGHILQVKCEGIGQVKPVNILNKFTKNLNTRVNFFDIHVGKFDSSDPFERSTPVTCFSFIDEKVSTEFKDIPSFRGINLVQLAALGEKNKALYILVQDITEILKSVCKNGIVEESIKISSIPIRYYVSSNASGTITGQRATPIPCFLLGDSAMGLPLEKGLNYGWMLSIQLVRFLVYSESMSDIQTGFDKCFDDISNKAISDVQTEYLKRKSTGKIASFIRDYIGLTEISRSVVKHSLGILDL
jgi:hypothetical protein